MFLLDGRLAAAMSRTPDDIPGAMRRYERARRDRSRRAQKAARSNSRIYHTRGAEAKAVCSGRSGR